MFSTRCQFIRSFSPLSGKCKRAVLSFYCVDGRKSDICSPFSLTKLATVIVDGAPVFRSCSRTQIDYSKWRVLSRQEISFLPLDLCFLRSCNTTATLCSSSWYTTDWVTSLPVYRTFLNLRKRVFTGHSHSVTSSIILLLLLLLLFVVSEQRTFRN